MHAPPAVVDRLDDPAEALVDGLDRLHRGLDHAGVADHVRVGEVDDRERRLLVVEVLDERVGGLARAHLRLVVVGRDVARGRHELAHLALVRVLLAAVEEVRHVRVLLGLRDVQLPEPFVAR